MLITLSSVSEQFDGFYRNRQYQAAVEFLEQLDFTPLNDSDLITYVNASRQYVFKLPIWNQFVTRVYDELVKRNNAKLATYVQSLQGVV